MAKDRGGDEKLPAATRGDTFGDAVRGLLDDVSEAAREALDTGRDLYRRGAMAVTHTAGDNGALAMLAGGAALAGVSWLLLRRRARRPEA